MNDSLARFAHGSLEGIEIQELWVAPVAVRYCQVRFLRNVDSWP